jgi:hypothetical protein
MKKTAEGTILRTYHIFRNAARNPSDMSIASVHKGVSNLALVAELRNQVRTYTKSKSLSGKGSLSRLCSRNKVKCWRGDQRYRKMRNHKRCQLYNSAAERNETRTSWLESIPRGQPDPLSRLVGGRDGAARRRGLYRSEYELVVRSGMC